MSHEVEHLVFPQASVLLDEARKVPARAVLQNQVDSALLGPLYRLVQVDDMRVVYALKHSYLRSQALKELLIQSLGVDFLSENKNKKEKEEEDSEKKKGKNGVRGKKREEVERRRRGLERREWCAGSVICIIIMCVSRASFSYLDSSLLVRFLVEGFPDRSERAVANNLGENPAFHLSRLGRRGRRHLEAPPKPPLSRSKRKEEGESVHTSAPRFGLAFLSLSTWRARLSLFFFFFFFFFCFHLAGFFFL